LANTCVVVAPLVFSDCRNVSIFSRDAWSYALRMLQAFSTPNPTTVSRMRKVVVKIILTEM
jgi:hypothetical protein